ncbi:hypothetical protein D3C73_663910 [compost metagenome]
MGNIQHKPGNAVSLRVTGEQIGESLLPQLVKRQNKGNGYGLLIHSRKLVLGRI